MKRNVVIFHRSFIYFFTRISGISYVLQTKLKLQTELKKELRILKFFFNGAHDYFGVKIQLFTLIWKLEIIISNYFGAKIVTFRIFYWVNL